jgi:hypothetical protein
MTSAGSNYAPEDCTLFLVLGGIRKHNKQQQTLELLIQAPRYTDSINL